MNKIFGENKERKVLIVEDERNLRKAIADVLHSNNFLPLEAKNGMEGVKLALSEHPDLILLDLIMPIMDGISTLKIIRADSWGANVPVIILTNVSATNEQLVDDVVTYKPLNYLIKSDWKLHDIVDKIKNVLKV